MRRAKHRNSADAADELGTRIPERTILGLCRHESDLRRLISLLRHGGIDIRKLSVVMLQVGDRNATVTREDETRALRTGLIIEGVVRHSGVQGSLLVAGPIKSCLTMDSGQSWFVQGLVRTLDLTLSAWGVDVEGASRFEAGLVAGRCLIALHVAPSEVSSALEAMQRSSAEHVTMVEHSLTRCLVSDENGRE